MTIEQTPEEIAEAFTKQELAEMYLILREGIAVRDTYIKELERVGTECAKQLKYATKALNER